MEPKEEIEEKLNKINKEREEIERIEQNLIKNSKIRKISFKNLDFVLKAAVIGGLVFCSIYIMYFVGVGLIYVRR